MKKDDKMLLTKLCASAGSTLEVISRDQGFPLATIFGDSATINVFQSNAAADFRNIIQIGHFEVISISLIFEQLSDTNTDYCNC